MTLDDELGIIYLTTILVFITSHLVWKRMIHLSIGFATLCIANLNQTILFN